MITKEYLQQELQRRIDGFKPGVETTTDLTIGEMKSILVLVDALNDYEYEKEYKSLVAKVKKAHQFAQTDSTKNVLEDILPELRESEDEKMVEMAIKAVLSPEAQSCIRSWGVNPDDVIAWLENQKKQKPISFSEPYNPDDYEVVMEGNATSLKRKEHKPSFGIYWHKIKKGEKLPCRAYIWNLDYEKHHDCFEGRLIANLENISVGGDTWYLPADDVRNLPREGVDELPREQKPAEAIDDQRQIAFMIEDGRRCGVIEGRKQVIDNPEKYGLQKPAEWSEEDEKNLGQVISGRYLPLGLREWFCGLPERFPSRSSWKPSEEQMEALQRAIDACESEWAYQDDELRSLLNDIKKL